MYFNSLPLWVCNLRVSDDESCCKLYSEERSRFKGKGGVDLHKRNDPVLILVRFDNNRMDFAFPSRQMGLLLGTFTFAAGLALLFHSSEVREKSMFSYWFLWLLEIAFTWGTISALNTNCRLAIDRSKETVSYFLSSLFRQQKWEKLFSEFQEVRIFRPATGDGRSGLLKILLKSTEGEEIPLGKSLFGIYRKTEAQRLANKLATMMSLTVIEESSIEKKFN